MEEGPSSIMNIEVILLLIFQEELHVRGLGITFPKVLYHHALK